MSTIAEDRAERYRQYRELIVGDISVHHAIPRMDEEEFFEFCLHNNDLRIEQDSQGNIHIMSPVSLDSGNLESQIIADLTLWARQTQLGKAYSSSTLFLLPDGEKRMPDAAWVSAGKLAQLTLSERRSFARVVPDFIVELKSPSDRATDLDRKIRDVWINNGVRMAWYIDPDEEISKIYKADGSIQIVQGFNNQLSGEDVLPGFVFDLTILKT